MDSYKVTEEESRRLAGGFLFSEEEIDKKISSLSGGERARVSFMKLIKLKPNVLILDEPTNHLDIYSREVLEESLEDYDGTILVVSHDRHFLESVVNKIYEVDENGATLFKGDYEDYKKQKAEPKKEKIENTDYEEQKRVKNRINSLEKKYSKLEEELEELELKKAELDEEYNLAGRKNDVSLLMELQEKIDVLDGKIMTTMEEWEEVEVELEELKEKNL